MKVAALLPEEMPENLGAAHALIAQAFANLFLLIFSLLLKPGDFHRKLLAKLRLRSWISCGLGDLPLKEDFPLGDLRRNLSIDFCKSKFLVVSQFLGRRLFFEPAHCEFERGFHEASIFIERSRTQKNCRCREDV